MGISTTLTGAKLKVFINNRIFGVATGLDYTIDTGRKVTYGIDKVNAFEIAPGQTSIKGRIECVRTHFDGGLEGRGISTAETDILAEKYITIQLVDRLTDKVIIKIHDAVVSRQSWDVKSKELMRGSFEFEGLTWTEAQ